MAHISLDVQGIARQVQGYRCTVDTQRVGIDTPLGLTGGRVDSCRITQGDVKVGICESCAIDLDGLF
jgi:hypothetical protein